MTAKGMLAEVLETTEDATNSFISDSVCPSVSIQ